MLFESEDGAHPDPRNWPFASTILCNSLPEYKKCSKGTGRFGVEMT